MKEEFTRTGIWWFPENPEDKFSGSINFSPTQGISLTFFKEGISPEKLFQTWQKDIILGITADGKKYTLYDCFSSGFSWHGHDEDTMQATYKARALFEGCHIERIDDIVFDEYVIQFSGIDYWYKGYNFKQEEVSNESNLRTFQVKCTRHAPIITAPKKDLTLKIVPTAQLQYDNPKAEISVETNFITKHSSPISFDQFQNGTLYLLQNFLSLGIGHSITPMELIGHSPRFAHGRGDKKIPKDIQIYYKNNPDSSIPKKSSYPQLFSYHEIESNFETCLQKWFEKSDTFKPMYDLYFGALRSSSMYLEHQFLSFAQAIEYYCRITLSDTKYAPQETFDSYIKELSKLMSDIKTDIDDETIEIFRNKCKNLNHRTFADHVTSLLDRLPSVLFDVGDINKETFPKNLTLYRNALTHNNKNRPESEDEFRSLMQITRQCALIIETCLLIELGLEETKIEKQICKSKNFVKLQK